MSGRQTMANMEVQIKGDKSAKGFFPKGCGLLASHGTYWNQLELKINSEKSSGMSKTVKKKFLKGDWSPDTLSSR